MIGNCPSHARLRDPREHLYFNRFCHGCYVVVQLPYEVDQHDQLFCATNLTEFRVPTHDINIIDSTIERIWSFEFSYITVLMWRLLGPYECTMNSFHLLLLFKHLQLAKRKEKKEVKIEKILSSARRLLVTRHCFANYARMRTFEIVLDWTVNALMSFCIW